jgi:hypothetical protein
MTCLARTSLTNFGQGGGLGVIAQAPDTEFFQIGGYVQHIGSGLFGYVAYGQLDADGGPRLNDFWYVKAGMRQRWHSLGHTVLYGEYKNSENNFLGNIGPDGDANTDDDFVSVSEVNLWGVGVVQEIDAAAMSMWLTYRNLSGSDSVFGDVADFQYVKFGALINF